MAVMMRPQARFRVLNAMPSTPTMDVEVDGSRAFSQVSYGQITDYVPVTAGQHTVTIYPAGEHTAPPLVEMQTNLRKNVDFTIAAIESAGQPDGMVVKDENPPSAPGRVRIRAMNVAGDIGPVDVTVKGGEDIFRNVGFGEVTGLAEVPVGVVDLEFKAARDGHSVQVIRNYRLAPFGRYTLVVLSPDRATGAVRPIEDRQGLTEKAG